MTLLLLSLLAYYSPCHVCRQNHAAYSFVVNLIIPGSPVLSLVAVFVNEHHPSILEQQQQQARNTLANVVEDGAGRKREGAADKVGEAAVAATATVGKVKSSSSDPATPLARSHSGASVMQSFTEMFQRTPSATQSRTSKTEPEGSNLSTSSHQPATSSLGVDADTCSSNGSSPVSKTAPTDFGPDKRDWEPFDHAFHRFLNASDQERTSMLKLIPGIAEGSWVIKQSVGTVPVIVGTKLKTTYYQTDRYLEACVDVTSSSAAAYITGKWLPFFPLVENAHKWFSQGLFLHA
jgi:hypothetical protein